MAIGVGPQNGRFVSHETFARQRQQRGARQGAAQAAPEALMPQNVEAEVGVLGSMLIDPEALGQVREILQSDDFYRNAHRTIFQGALDYLDANGKAPDLITLGDELERTGKLEDVGGISVISSLANQVPTYRNVLDYARIVARCAAQRRRIQLAGEIANAYYDPNADVTALDLYFSARLQEEGQRLHGAGVTGVTAEELQHMDIPEPQFIIGGLIPVGLSLLAAKQKIGKSWLGLDLTLAVPLGGRAIGAVDVMQGSSLYLALEDTHKSLKKRIRMLLGDELRWPAKARLETEWPRLDQGGLAALERWIEETPDARLIVIDVLAKVRAPRDKSRGDMYDEDYAVMGPLKALADKYGIAIVVIHHARKSAAEDVFDEILGSAGLTGSSDATLLLKRSRTEADAVLHVTGRSVDEAQYALRFDKTRGQWTLLGDAKEHAVSHERRAILDLLEAEGPLKPHEIASRLSANPSTTRVLLSRLLSDGAIECDAGGRYSVKRSH